MAVGLNHNAAMSVAGDIYVWGQNKHGCLGVGDTLNRVLPTKVSAQAIHSCPYSLAMTARCSVADYTSVCSS